VTSVKDDEKLTQNVMMIRELKHAICVFSETHRCETGIYEDWTENSELDGWKFINSGSTGQKFAGVGVVLSDQVELVEYEVIMAARILYVRVVYRGVRLQLFATYAPTNMKSEAVRQRFYKKLSDAKTEKGKKYPNWPKLSLGDFNATIGVDAPDCEFIGPSFDKTLTTENGMLLIEMLNEHRMYALNTLYQARDSHRITFKLGRSKKRLDYFIADGWLMRNCLHARAYREQSEIFKTNHFLTVARFRVPCKLKRKIFFQKRAPKPKINVSALRDDLQVRAHYSDLLENYLNFESFEDASANELERIMVENIHKAATEAIPIKQPDDLEWVTPEYSAMLKNYKNVKNKTDRKKFGKKIEKTRKKTEKRVLQEARRQHQPCRRE